MSALGHCGDNAACEGFFGLLKRERVYRTNYPTLAAARADVFDHIEPRHDPRMRRRVATQDQKVAALLERSVVSGYNPPSHTDWRRQPSRSPMGTDNARRIVRGMGVAAQAGAGRCRGAQFKRSGWWRGPSSRIHPTAGTSIRPGVSRGGAVRVARGTCYAGTPSSASSQRLNSLAAAGWWICRACTRWWPT